MTRSHEIKLPAPSLGESPVQTLRRWDPSTAPSKSQFGVKTARLGALDQHAVGNNQDWASGRWANVSLFGSG